MCGAIDLKQNKKTLLAAFLNFRIKKKYNLGIISGGRSFTIKCPLLDAFQRFYS